MVGKTLYSMTAQVLQHAASGALVQCSLVLARHIPVCVIVRDQVSFSCPVGEAQLNAVEVFFMAGAVDIAECQR